MKKIAIIVKNTTFNKSFGGLEVHTKSLIELLSKEFEIDIFAPKRELKNLVVKENNKNYYFIDSDYKTGYFSDFFKKNWNHGLYSFFKNKYEENKYNLIISISSSGYPILKKKEEFNCNFLTISHGTALSEYLSLYNEGGLSFSLIRNTPYFIYNYFFKQKEFIKKSDYVICVSEYVKNNLIKETESKDIYKFKTIFNGAWIEKDFIKEFKSLGKLKIIFAGRVEISKGILVLLESIKYLDTHLYVAGDGVALEQSKKFVFENKIAEKVTFLGRLNSDNLINFYKDCDILIVPSLRVEGFPMSIIEGMSYYLPVIASKIGGNSDAVVDSKTGFLVTPGVVSELSEKINFFNTYPEKIKEFGINARNLVTQRFSNEGMIKEYLEVINKLLK